MKWWLIAGVWTACNAGLLALLYVGTRKQVRRPRLDHECDVYAGAEDRDERLIGLYLASRELDAAVERVTAGDDT